MVVYFYLFSGVCGIMGVVLLVKRVRFYRKGVRTTGRFVRWHLEVSSGQNGGTLEYFSPIVSFQADNGEFYEFVGPGASFKRKRNSYPVIYFPKNPKDAMVFTLVGFWAAPFAFLVLSAAAAAAAFGMG